METQYKDLETKKKYFNIRKIFNTILSITILFISIKFKIFRIFFYIIIFIIITTIIIIYRQKKISENNSEKAGYREKWNDLYGEKILNIPYFKDDKIINSFKKSGDNYNEILGDINNGQDYSKNDRNYYNLFIPYSSLKKRDKFQGIILFIHGGAWIGGEKENIEYLSIRYAKLGYITAEMNHTLLIPKYGSSTIFRIMDDVNACILSIKEQLKNRGFNENKLEIAICGYSSGAHITLLYGYSIKNIPLPLKFLINFVGPITLDPEYWYKVKGEKCLLDNIESSDIEKAKKEGKFDIVFEDEFLLGWMNVLLGKKYSDGEIKEMLENKKINENNMKYKELSNLIKYAYPTTYINENSVPTLCQYGGFDYIIGTCHFSLLKKLSEKYGNKLVNIYMKKGGHDLISVDNEDGINSMREMHYQILNFCETYFTIDN